MLSNSPPFQGTKASKEDGAANENEEDDSSAAAKEETNKDEDEEDVDFGEEIEEDIVTHQGRNSVDIFFVPESVPSHV